MSIKPVCDSCKGELTEFGAILLGSPDATGMSKKLHLCVDCYKITTDTLNIQN